MAYFIVHPHIIKNKQLGQIVDLILKGGFEISALQMIWLDTDTAK